MQSFPVQLGTGIGAWLQQTVPIQYRRRFHPTVNKANVRTTCSQNKHPTKGTCLNNADIGFFARFIYANLADSSYPVLDGIGDVRYHLNGLAKVVAAALLFNDITVDLSGGDVVFSGEGNIEESFIVSEVKVNFTAVIQDKHFTMVKRTEGACINVQIRVDLDGSNTEAKRLE